LYHHYLSLRIIFSILALGSHVVFFPPGEWNGATCVSFVQKLICRLIVTFRIVHDLFLPVWKSNVSVTLMIDKKAKRQVFDVQMTTLLMTIESCSATSLRLFGKDLTAAGRGSEQGKGSGIAPDPCSASAQELQAA
jgi:hypothetical protein